MVEGKAVALAAAQRKSENLCKGFEGSTLYKFRSAQPEAQEWDCRKLGAGFSCGFDGQAVCDLEEKSTKVEETCGSGK
jgi:hypothetical protein